MKKLFKKLNEQLAVQNLKSEEITESEIKDIEGKVIFENFVEDTSSNILNDDE